MSGRPKHRIYQYRVDGSFMQEFESESDASRKFYNNRRPLFQEKDYHLIGNTSILVKERIGRDNIKRLVKKVNSVFISSTSDKRVVECLNLNNEVIATYKNAYFAALLSTASRSTIESQLKVSKLTKLSNDLIFRYGK